MEELCPFIEPGVDGFVIFIVVDIQRGAWVGTFQGHEPGFHDGRNAAFQVFLGGPSAEVFYGRVQPQSGGKKTELQSQVIFEMFRL